MIAASALLAGIGIELFAVFWDTSLQAHVPNEVLSRVSAWDAIGSLVLIPAAYAIVGPLADAIGIDATLWLCAGIVLVAITAQLLSREVRELPRLPPAHAQGSILPLPRWIARPASPWRRTAASTRDAVELGGVTVLRADAAPAQPDAEPDRRPRRGRARHRGGCSTQRSRQSATTSAATWRRPGRAAGGARRLAARARPRARLGLDVVPAQASSRCRRPPTSLRLVPVGEAEAEAFGRIVAAGYGLPEAVGAVGCRARTRPAGTAGSRSTATSRRRPPASSSRTASATSASPRRCRSTGARAGRARCSRDASSTRARRAATSSSPRRASAGTTCPRTRTATSSAQGSRRWRCGRTGSAPRASREPRDEPLPPQEARAHQHEPRRR